MLREESDELIKPRGIKRLKKVRDRKKFAAWDTETAGLGGKLLAVSWCLEDGAPHYYTNKNPDKIIGRMVEVFFEHPDYIWYAHNAQYDWRYLIPHIRKEAIPVKYMARNDNNLFALEFTEEKILLVDSMAVWPKGLDEFAQKFCPEFPKLKINIANFQPDNPEHIEYSKRDSLSLVTALVRFNDAIKECYGVNLSLTIASTGMSAWRQTIPEGVSYFGTPRYESFIRKCYYGGLVLPLNTNRHENCKTFDINSSYPAVMRKHPFPHGQCYPTNVLDENKLGFFGVYVKTPDNLHCPILGYRVPGKRQTFWPSGEFITYVTTPEILFARKHGYTVEIIKGIEYFDSVRPFVDFVNISEAARNKYKGESMEIVPKNMQNSNYGKFCCGRERNEVFDSYHPDIKPEDLMGAIPLNDDGLYRKPTFCADMFVIPAWGVYITAYARLALLEMVYKVGVENVLYGDTDSLTVRDGIHIPISNDYGGFKLDKDWLRFRAVAPKVYAGQLRKTGEWVGAAKGMPAKLMESIYWEAVYDNRRFSLMFETLPGFMQFLKGNGDLKNQHRAITDSKNSINWKCVDGLMFPRTVIENIEALKNG